MFFTVIKASKQRIITTNRHLKKHFIDCMPQLVSYMKYSSGVIPILKPWAIKRGVRNFCTCLEKGPSISMEIASEFNFLPPETVRGMTKLNKDLFKYTVTIPSVIVPKEKLLSGKKKKERKIMREVCFRMHKLKTIVDLDDCCEISATHKRLLLNPSIVLHGHIIEDKQSLFPSDMNISNCDIEMFDIELTYNNWTHSELIKAILPKESDGVAGFAAVGHIIHLNLRSDSTAYKHIIGEILLDKLSTAKTVVNKLDIIDNTFRNFQMEVIAGEPDFITSMKEHGCVFKMDFSQVYWNSRLSTEHTRIVDLLNKEDVVFDVFAGIGPFAIPAGKKNCKVFANDLNPESVRWLDENIRINKVKTVTSSNLDGRLFIRTIAKDNLLKIMKNRLSSKGIPNVHFVMNLPALAIEFTDVFPGLLSDVNRSDLNTVINPTVHCYCFSNAEDLEQDVKSRIEDAMNVALPSDCQVRFVRNVAPKKDMMCATFKLSDDVMFGAAKKEDSPSETVENEPPFKKMKDSVID